MPKEAISFRNAEFALIHLVFSIVSILFLAIGVIVFQSPVSRYYTLPISTATLVAWKLLLPCAGVGCVFAFVFVAINTLFSLELPILSGSLFAFAFSAPCFLFLIQSSSLSIWSFSSGLIIMLGLGYFGRTRYGDPSSIPTHLWMDVTLGDMAILLGAIVLSYGIALRIVRADRCGEPWISSSLSKKLRRIWSNQESHSKLSLPNFRSPSEAQFWYEFRQKSAGFPAITGLAVSMILLPLPIHVAIYGFKSISELPNVTTAIEFIYQGIFAFGMFFYVFAFLAGIFVGCADLSGGKRQQAPTLSELVNQNNLIRMGAFQATLPVVPWNFSLAIFRTIIQSLFTTWCVWFVLFAGVSIALRLFQPNVDTHDFELTRLGYWGVPLTLLGPWIVMSNVASICLTGRNRFVFLMFLTPVVMFVGTAVIVDVIESNHAAKAELFAYGCFDLLSLGCILGTVFAFFRAKRRKLIGPQTLLGGLAMSGVIFAVATILTPIKLLPSDYLMILGFAAMAVLPIATIPLAIEWNRHR
jgi:hypothetical protein